MGNQLSGIGNDSIAIIIVDIICIKDKGILINGKACCTG